VSLPTWGRLLDYHCAEKIIRDGPAIYPNPFYEQCAHRRYNYALGPDTKAFRLIFLKGVLDNPDYKTLCRHGRFIWCKNLQYEGLLGTAWRHVSFTVDSGKKRFCVGAHQVLCVPSDCFIANNHYMRRKEKIFHPFSSVFDYDPSVSAMAKAASLPRDEFDKVLKNDNLFKPGTLVAPRVGYFCPRMPTHGVFPREEPHPCGLVLGPSLAQAEYFRREFYRVRFGATTYEKVHPLEMEIINEV
jgi:hypothetical protein